MYLTNSPLLTQIAFKSSRTFRMTSTRQYDLLNRLQSVASVGGASNASPIAFGYDYNQANQRTRRSEADGSTWMYDYDRLGQGSSGGGLSAFGCRWAVTA